MTALNLIRRSVACAAVVGALTAAAPILACETGNCVTGAKAEPSAQAAPSKPLTLRTHMRKPVATSATRTVKKKNGEYAQAASKRRPTQRVADTAAVAPDATTSAVITPAAAQAFASYELARVRVLTPEELGSASLTADFAAASPNATTVVSVDNVQVDEAVEVADANEVNDIDRRADTLRAVSLDALSRDMAGSRHLAESPEPKAADDSTWLQRMLMVLGSAFAAAAALVRTLVG